jgi:hypothetical protein
LGRAAFGDLPRRDRDQEHDRDGEDGEDHPEDSLEHATSFSPLGLGFDPADLPAVLDHPALIAAVSPGAC